jgi:hypothetical protein
MIRQKFRKDSGNEPTTVCAFHVKPPDPPEPTVWRLVCEQTGDLVNQWCPNPVNREYSESQVPTFVCTVHAEPMVTKKICKDTGNLVNPFCPNPIDFSYPQSQVPTIICYIHKEPIPKCPDPYPKGKLRVVVYTLLGGLAMKEIPEWPDNRLAEYYNALVLDGVNAERYVSTCKPGDPYDPLEYWQLEDPEYLGVITKRLNLMRERDLTAIICLQPYRGTISDDRARWLIRALRGYPIIWECENEPADNDNQERLVEILKSEGIPNNFIQIELVDSGAFYDLLHKTLNDEGLATYHWTGTMETIHAPWPKGWSTSSGMMEFMKMGLYGSNDGQDTMRAAKGLNFWLHDHQNPPITEYRRPNNEQLGAVSAWFRAHGKGHVEHLSAAAYQRSASPNMDDAISIGRAERQAMSP